jgi:hypothetical protein
VTGGSASAGAAVKASSVAMKILVMSYPLSQKVRKIRRDPSSSPFSQRM